MKQILYTKKLLQLLLTDITNLNLFIVRVVKYEMKENVHKKTGKILAFLVLMLILGNGLEYLGFETKCAD